MKLRGKLLLVSLSLLVLPWAGWQFMRLVADVLREGQDQALVATAEAVARGLALRSANLPPPGPTLFAPTLARSPVTDADDSDWHDVPGYRFSGQGAGFRVHLGRADDRLHLLIDVDDITPARSDAHWPIADRRDHVRLALHGRQGVVDLRLANAAPGALIVTGSDGNPPPLQVTGHWHEREDGYRIELALPQGYALRALAIVVQDVDEAGAVRQVDSGRDSGGRPWAVLTRSEALASSLAQLLPSGMHAQVLDRERHVLADAGSLGDITGDEAVPVWRRWLYRHLLFADTMPGDDDDRRHAAATAWQADPDSGRLLQTATLPITAAGQARAVLALSRRSDAVLRLTDRAFSGLFAASLLALLAVVVGLLLFAGRLSGRIRRLRDAADNALDRDGRVHAFPVSGAGDEIGDLSRAFARLLDEVGVYTGYLRGLAGKLSHEINTPIAIVRTSLENLEADPKAAEARVYLERARGGIDRLGTLVRAMSEASRIEQAIESAEGETVDLVRLVGDCAEGYRPLLAPRRLDIERPASPLSLFCAPDLIVQALDKLIDNAGSFCPLEGWVRITLAATATGAEIAVANSGPPLPASMRDKLFDSLVSVRERRPGHAVHLGVGLHVVKLVASLHRGLVRATDLPGNDGVEFTLRLVGLVTRPVVR